eukprot:CAMPEP_0171794036 /NCGR_PEP_ID=MMETSP0991-20121206/67892_1 /TAXON_ID=483369 /ORGANISM="non described non described, Strain CCMP2098" /LENGTH=378 /DNA_ID=CAMNT_0012404373 /DNA_START=97 /DNA_END=1234 /DNA_ORIENTATION=-
MIVLEIIAARQDLVLRNINIIVTMEVVLGESPTTIPLILAPKYDEVWLDRWEMGDERRRSRERRDGDGDGKGRDRSHRDDSDRSRRHKDSSRGSEDDRRYDRSNNRRGSYRREGSRDRDDDRRRKAATSRRSADRDSAQQSDDAAPLNPSSASTAASAKAKSGVLQYLKIPLAANTASAAAAAAKTGAAESSSVNTSSLRRVLQNDQRSGDRHDRLRAESAQAKLQAISGSARPGDKAGGDTGSGRGGGGGGGGGDRGGAAAEPVHLKTVTKTATASGAKLRDSYSHGMRPDVASEKSLPYECDVCEPSHRQRPPPSFLTATQLSDHLERRHGVRRHPSLIRPTKKKATAAQATAGGAAGSAGRGGGDESRDEQDLNL